MAAPFNRIEPASEEKILGIDPGITTGIALFEWPKLLAYEQYKKDNPIITAQYLRRVIAKRKPDVVVMEDYRVYPWKSQTHIWSQLWTVRLIGAIQLVCLEADVSLVLQGANRGKSIKDDALKQWGFYIVSKQHARDAIRHCLSYAIFGEGGQ